MSTPGQTGRTASESNLPSRARPVKARLDSKAQAPEHLPARMVNEFVYCARLFFYEWVEGVFAHSADTVEGAWRHERVDAKQDSLPAADAMDADEALRARSVSLSSDTHGLTATIDLVEGVDGVVCPVDYKKGRPRDTEEGPGVWPADEAQVCVQALVLRDNGYRCDEAVVYYQATRQRVRVSISQSLVEQTLRLVADARQVAETGQIPPPLADSRKCPRCSLVGICLPDETGAALGWNDATEEDSQPSLFPLPADGSVDGSAFDSPAGKSPAARQLVTARDDLRPLYVTGFGLTVGRTGDVLEIREKTTRVQDARLNDVSQVNLFGPVTVTGGAIHALCAAEKPIAHFTKGGWFQGLTTGMGLRNVFLRQAQFRRADDPLFRLHVARSWVANKIRNQRVLLQRNHVEPPVPALRRLKELARQAERCWQVESLLGLEGLAGRIYFEHFGGMLKVQPDDPTGQFTFEHRNRRPPRDPVNALLSLAYALLVKEMTATCLTVGFDPFMGFYHRPRFGRPALALDLMEPFRALIADSVVLTAVNGRSVTADDFISAGRAVSLTPRGRRSLIHAYELRMDTQVTHPLFGYRVSYRRVLEIQTRLFARLVSGEISACPRFETR